MHPVVGQIIHRDQLELFDLDGCRLNWRPDNTAKVTRPEPDLCGMIRCSAAGKPHTPDAEKDGRGRCYDHDPYIVGGVVVWGTTCEANVERQRPEGYAERSCSQGGSCKP